MKTLTLLHMFFCLWIVAAGHKNEDIRLKRVGKADGEILISFPADKLPLAILWGMVDDADPEIVNLTGFDKPDTNVGTLFRCIDDADFAIDAPCYGCGNVSPIFLDNVDCFILNIENRVFLGKTDCRCQQNDKCEKHPFHGANIVKN